MQLPACPRPISNGMNIAEDLKARGLVEHSSADVATILGTPRTVYLGIDPTADSLHVGHLVPILFMKRLAAAGHKLVFLVGGGTGMIGDPKEKGERVLLDEKTISKNTEALKKQLEDILGRLPFKMVDNATWLSKVRLVPFLRDIGKHFTVNDLVKRDLIAKRLATPDESISYTEFTYSLLQAYDYLELNTKYHCDLQVGASDQWTNILSGVDLIRKKKEKKRSRSRFLWLLTRAAKSLGNPKEMQYGLTLRRHLRTSSISFGLAYRTKA